METDQTGSPRSWGRALTCLRPARRIRGDRAASERMMARPGRHSCRERSSSPERLPELDVVAVGIPEARAMPKYEAHLAADPEAIVATAMASRPCVRNHCLAMLDLHIGGRPPRGKSRAGHSTTRSLWKEPAVWPRCLPKRDRRFESGFLQERVHCELDRRGRQGSSHANVGGRVTSRCLRTGRLKRGRGAQETQRGRRDPGGGRRRRSRWPG